MRIINKITTIVVPALFLLGYYAYATSGFGSKSAGERSDERIVLKQHCRIVFTAESAEIAENAKNIIRSMKP